MARSGLDLGAPNGAFSSAQISEHKESTGLSYINDDDGDDGGVQVTCFSEVVNETTFHLQIIRLLKQFVDMMSLNFDDQDGILRTILDAPPTHYTVKVQSISLLTKHNLEKYESGDFEVGGYKWKMQLYPNGKGNGFGTHLSFFLALAEPKSLRPGCQIYAEFTLRILDQQYGSWYISANHRFSASNSMRGWMRFTTMGSFNQAYIVLNDTCIAKADVIVHGITNALWPIVK
ncbi:hypothetical protein C1H46_011582 [Malus baccata]|uniref:MATH domain-containing protein n=1 Tax=Malus baccata TaxID=106549 RepID=A0A540MWW6_MALBA|nr:hypothetical protein C1H46_011582 [Malus baccata]